MTQQTETVAHSERPVAGLMHSFSYDGLLYHCTAEWPGDLCLNALEEGLACGWPWLHQLQWFSQLKKFEQINQINRNSDYLLVRVYQGQQLAVALPLRTTDGSQTLLALSNYYSPEFAPLTVLPVTAINCWPLLFCALSALWPQWCQLRLQPLTLTTIKQIKQHCPAKAALLESPYGHNWRASANTSLHYWQQRQSQLVNTIRRKKKKLLQQGADIQIHRQLTPDLLTAYWHIYQHSWKQPEPSPDFINWLLEFSSAQGQLRLGLLRINGAPVAFQFWLVQQQKAAIVKLSQDQAFDALSPGTVLMAAMIDDVMTQDGVTDIDFLTGNDDYKAQWMDECLPLWQLDLVNCQSIAGKILYLKLKVFRQISQLKQQWRERVQTVTEVEPQTRSQANAISAEKNE